MNHDPKYSGAVGLDRAMALIAEAKRQLRAAQIAVMEAQISNDQTIVRLGKLNPNILRKFNHETRQTSIPSIVR